MHIEAYSQYPSSTVSMSVSTPGDMDGMTYANPYRPAWRCAAPPGHSFGGLDDQLLARVELVNDMSKSAAGIHSFLRHESSPTLYGLDPASGHHPGCGGIPRPAHQLPHHLYSGMPPGPTPETSHPPNFDPSHMAQHMAEQQGSMAAANRAAAAAASYPYPTAYSAAAAVAMSTANQHASPSSYTGMTHSHELDYDPRELEAFAERFKQRRIKLGVTQADVGRALGNLKLTGVGSLSQSTICRFESLTLSHNNMVALKPVLQAWLEEAERQAAERQKNPDVYGDLADKKRKRTSITDAEKRSLEAYFAIQPRPSSEKIAQISEKLNLKKNVVRVWFCNQRQKQKRMKFSSIGLGHHSAQSH